MRTYLYGYLCLAVSVVSLSCASVPPPATRAASVKQMQCSATVASQDPLILSTKVLSVEPLYAHIMTNNTSEERVEGAKLVIRPPPGVTAEQMTRVLQCHGARVLLGQVSPDAVRNDPFWLPDGWVKIDVTPENGNFAVTLSAESLPDNLKVLGRASHYADDHVLATEPELP